MARLITPTYTFTPGSHQINLSGIAGFDVRALAGIVNLTTGGVVYARGLPGFGYSAISGTTLTLQASMAGMASSDVLSIKYDLDAPTTIATFAPIRGAAVAVSVAPAATTTPIAMPACVANTYRVRNPASSASPASWSLAVNRTSPPVLPGLYNGAGTGGSAGDSTIDPGGVEIFGLTTDQQTALAAGTLYLSVICQASGSAVLEITFGNGG